MEQDNGYERPLWSSVDDVHVGEPVAVKTCHTRQEGHQMHQKDLSTEQPEDTFDARKA